MIYKHHKTMGGNKWLLDDVSDNFFLGHVRHATKGKISEKNAHPFEKENIVGMHNGTLDWKDYDPKGDITDSEMMFQDFSDYGVEYVLKSLDPKSAYAITALDLKTNEIVFARNDLRPLSYTWNMERSVLYYASEWQMLAWILDRNGIKREKIFSLVPEVVYRVSPLDIRKGQAPSFKKIALKNFNNFNKTSTIKTEGTKGVDSSPVSLIKRSQQQKTEEEREKSSTGSKTTKNTTTQSKQQSQGRHTVKPVSDFHRSCISCKRNLTLIQQNNVTSVMAFGVKSYICEYCLPPGDARTKQDWINANYRLVGHVH